MKILLSLVLTGLAFSTHASELDDVNSIVLSLPVSYEKKSSPIKSDFEKNLDKTIAKYKSQAIVGGAKLIKTDVQKLVDEAFTKYRSDLAKYYPKAGELDAVISKAVDEGISRHLKNGLNDKDLVQFYKYLGQNLVSKFFDRILEVEGVSAQTRREIWVNKLLLPFNKCVDTSDNGYYDAARCIDVLASSVTPNAGLGLVYELSNSLLSTTLPEKDRSKFNNNQVMSYRACIGKADLKLNATNIVGCALNTMKGGIEYVTSLALSQTIKEKASSEAKAKTVMQTVWPSFTTCTAKVNSSGKGTYAEQFFNCIDNLVSNTGGELVVDKISNTQAVKDAFTPAQVLALSSEKSAQFKKCAEEQRKKGERKNGILNIDPCELQVTNEVTYKVVSETLKNTTKSTFKAEPQIAQALSVAALQHLDHCWNNKQAASAREACLRETIVNFSGQVANAKLNLAIPNDMPGKTDLMKSSVGTLGKCVEEVLPDNISESSDLMKRIDTCSGKLTRGVALKVATYEIKSTAQGNIPDNMINSLVESLVEKDFSNCIGASPTDDQLNTCTNALTTKAGKTISETAFNKEVNNYAKNAGGVKALGLTQSQMDAFLKDLVKSNNECIDRKPVIGIIMDQVNACIKNSVKKIAFFFGDAQFNKSIGNMYAKREEEKKKLQTQFKVSLSDCLAQKDGKQFSISDYTKNLYTCSDKIAHSTTLIVGKDQIDSNLNDYLKDRPGIPLKEKREGIRNQVMGKFNTCMTKETNANKCIDALKREATGLIVLNYGRVETKAQLNADVIPDELKPVEMKFSQCIDSKLEGDELTVQLDKCTESFALDFARALGALKLNYLLKQTLGTAEFEKQKKDILSSLEDYNSCLDDLKKYSMSEGLTEKLSICTDKLTRTGMNIVRSSLNDWMTTQEKDAATVMIKQEFANFLPCLSALLPTSPYAPLEENIESSVKPLAVLLTHYIEYNPENAKLTLDGIILKLSVDLNDVAATTKAKKDLLDFLEEKQGLDQFIKAIVRGTVKDALIDIPDKEVPMSLREVMLKKEIFEDIFNSAEGKHVKAMVMDKLLRPALIDGADMRGDVFKTNMDNVKEQVIRLLLYSPKFGEQVIKLGVQKQIDDMGGVTKFFAKALYGGEALQWDKVRTTKEGKQAEAYIRDYVLMPKFKGTVQTEAEKKKINEEAEKLVKKAVKNYG